MTFHSIIENVCFSLDFFLVWCFVLVTKEKSYINGTRIKSIFPERNDPAVRKRTEMFFWIISTHWSDLGVIELLEKHSFQCIVLSIGQRLSYTHATWPKEKRFEKLCRAIESLQGIKPRAKGGGHYLNANTWKTHKMNVLSLRFLTGSWAWSHLTCDDSIVKIRVFRNMFLPTMESKRMIPSCDIRKKR